MPKYLSFFAAVISNKCPVCRTGSIWKSNKLYSPAHLTKMHEKCPVCNSKLQPEPGFYFGAAYVSYALTVALWIAIYFLLFLLDVIGLIEFTLFENITTFLLSGVISLILLTPKIYRLSRSIWASMFLNFDIEKAEKAKKD